jgi:hypothetical protein
MPPQPARGPSQSSAPGVRSPRPRPATVPRQKSATDGKLQRARRGSDSRRTKNVKLLRSHDLMHWGHSIARDTVKKILVCCTMARATDFIRFLSDPQGQSPQSMPLQLPPAGCCWPTNRWRSPATSRPSRPSAPTGPAKTRQQQCTHPTQKDNDSAREGRREEPTNKQTPMQRAVEATENRCAWLAIRPSNRTKGSRETQHRRRFPFFCLEI